MNRYHGLEVALSVRPAFLEGHLVSAGVLAKDGDGLLLTVVGLAHTGPLGPGVVLRPLVRSLGHHLDLDHRAAAVADGSAHTVVARVAAPHDDHVLAHRIQIAALFQSRVQQGSGGGGEEIHRKVNSLSIPPSDRQIPGLLCPAGQDDRVVLLQQRLGGHITAHVTARAESHPLGGHQVHPPLDKLLLQLHVGDAVHQQATHPVRPLKDGDQMAPAVELVGGGQARRAGAHHCYLFACAHLGGTGADGAGGVPLLHDGQLVLLDGDRIAVEPAGAGRLTQGGAHPAGKLRKVIGLVQALEGVVRIPMIYQVVPLGHQIVQRAAGEHPRQLHPRLAEGHAALHAPGPLPPPLLLGEHGVKLVPVPDALQGALRRVAPALIFQKSSGLSHQRSPPVTA